MKVVKINAFDHLNYNFLPILDRWRPVWILKIEEQFVINLQNFMFINETVYIINQYVKIISTKNN